MRLSCIEPIKTVGIVSVVSVNNIKASLTELIDPVRVSLLEPAEAAGVCCFEPTESVRASNCASVEAGDVSSVELGGDNIKVSCIGCQITLLPTCTVLDEYLAGSRAGLP